MGNTAPHSAEIEIGRPAGHRPDYGDILGWTMRKLVGRGLIDAESAPHVAMSITNNIEAKGLPATYLLRGMLTQIAYWAMQYQIKKMNRRPGWKLRRGASRQIGRASCRERV